MQQAASALDRAKRKADADKRQAQADLTAKEAEFTRQQTKLQKILDQLTKTRIVAPNDGLVVYASSTKGGLAGMLKEPLTEGQQVFEREELIYLPADASAMVEVNVHEASLAKVRIGQPAIVTVETLPGKRFLGTVGMVAPLPDSAGMFLNPDLKVFKTQIYLESDDPDLRSGMTCRAEIVIEQYEDAIYVPVQAVTRIAARRAGLRARGQVDGAAQSRDRHGQQSDGPNHQRARRRPGGGARSAAEIRRRHGFARRLRAERNRRQGSERVR